MNTSQTGQMCSDTSPYKVVCEYYGVRPGLMIMGGDSSTRGHEFESQYHIIFHIYLLQKLFWCLKSPKNEKEVSNGPF